MHNKHGTSKILLHDTSSAQKAVVWTLKYMSLINHTHRSGFLGNLKNGYWQFVLVFKQPLAQHVLPLIRKAIFWNKKIITHLTERNTLYRATVITKYLHTHHVSCIITFHFCTFSIMIMSSYFLSKYTNNLTIKDILNSRNTFLRFSTLALFNGHCIIQTARRNQNAFVCHLWAANHSHRAGPATVIWAHATCFQAPVRVCSGWWGLLSCTNRA